MSSPNLNISHIAANQDQKEVTANEAFDALDRALTGLGEWDVGEGGPDEDSFRMHFAWKPDEELTEDATFGVPDVRRPFVILNPSDTYSITVVAGDDSFDVSPETAGWFYYDGDTLWKLS
ncbi:MULTISPECIES: hypothetical protein [unclassified Thioalkalivibrio]|uniref:hypothetical protein n=1 Tax=unclassified Thioalkalivibrio TaxID=2621013 RepID=UPI000380A823|nr:MULTISPECIES: hypothetical protein [unclassified Thioalkalivibrio]